MNVIQPNCRVQFSAEDVEFIVTTVSGSSGDHSCLTGLLTDPGARDQILDDPRLLHALLEHRGCLGVSQRLYFYVLVRQVFLRSGIKDRVVADYVAELLTEFSSAQRLRCAVAGEAVPMDYFFEMLAALQRVDDRTRFTLRAHIGNCSLFLTGVFPERIRFRAESRGFPDLGYYEQLGRSSFRAASDHRLARRGELGAVLGALSDQFHETRLALNDIAERLFAIGDPDVPAEFLLGQGGNAGAN